MLPIVPLPLERNDRIQVVAPAGPVEKAHLDFGIDKLSQRYTPEHQSDILDRHGYLAGSDDRRRHELQRALDDRDIKAVIAARGGFGITGILDTLDFSGILESPKWIVGSSDITALLIHLFAAHRYLTIHGPMVAGFHRAHEGDVTALMDLLAGRPWPGSDGLKGLCNGTAKGPLIGGNLTILAHLSGTLSFDFADGAILFLEDVGERPFRLDRCLVQLWRAGMLERVGGVVLGELTACEPGPDGVTAEEAIGSHLSRLRVPVAAGYPAAHGSRNAPFVHGLEVRLEVRGQAASVHAAT
jgi:muramoyltetrapeptide carboxypeptidase